MEEGGGTRRGEDKTAVECYGLYTRHPGGPRLSYRYLGPLLFPLAHDDLWGSFPAKDHLEEQSPRSEWSFPTVALFAA
jgi:hypothetical protein